MWTQWLFPLVWLHLFGIACSVQIEDAFKRDSLTFTYKTLNEVSLIDTDHVLGVAPSPNQLLKINVQDQSYAFAIDVLDQHTNYKVVGDKVVTFSSSSTVVHVYDSIFGIYIDKVTLDASPAQIATFYDDGLLILDNTGSLSAWKSGFHKQIGKYSSSTDSFHTSFTDGLLYVAINENVICLNDQAQNIIANVAASSQIVQFADGLVLSDKEAFYVSDHIAKFKTNFKNPVIVDKEHVVDINGADVVLHKIDADRKISSEKLTTLANAKAEVVSSVVVVYNDEEAEIFDLDKKRASVDLSGAYINSRVSGDVVSVAFKQENQVVVKTGQKAYVVPLSQAVPNNKAILVDKLEDPSTLDKAHHLAEEVHFTSPVLRWVTRTKNHLSQLGRFATSLLHNKKPETVVTEDKYGFGKLLAFYDEEKELLVVKDRKSVVFETPVSKHGDLVDLASLENEVYLIFAHKIVTVNIRDGQILRESTSKSTLEKAVKLAVDISEQQKQEHAKSYTLAVKSGKKLNLLKEDVQVSNAQFYIDQDSYKLHGYKIQNLELVPTWTFSEAEEKIIKFSKNLDHLSHVPGISKADRSVVYKYLNPNLVTVITQNIKNSQLSVYLVDGITGTLLHAHRHENETVDESSINLVQNDNWIVYTYFTTAPKVEQRIVSIDLFSDKSIAEGAEKSAFGEFNLTIAKLQTKSYIYPERINLVETTHTKFGISIKSLIALTNSGALVEIPHYLVSARRIDDRKLEPSDHEEFKVLPYQPVLWKDNHQVINHKQKLILTGNEQILVRPTELESTVAVCFVNEANQLCSYVQPSSSYDILSGNFDKIKLLITIGVLFVVYVVTKPLVHSKKLNAKWVD